MISDATRQRYAAFAEGIHRSHGRGRWLILTHDSPDPDALASASILSKILRRGFNCRATIAYGGMIGRAENLEMVRSLRLKLSRLRHLNWKHYQHFALVDSQPRTGNNQLPDDIVPDLVFDHHPLRPDTRPVPFYDVREEYGATATILGEYLLASEVEASNSDAVALVYAIRTETQDFLRDSTGPDRKLYDHFFLRANKQLLGRIQSPRLPLGYFSTLRQALESLEGVSPLVICHLGVVDQPEIVPEMADLFLRLEGRTWSLCTGLYEDRIYLSIRTTNPRADAASLMRRILGKKGKGGGHGMLAGGWYPLGGLASPEHLGAQKQLAHRLARLLKKDPKKIVPISLERP